MRRGRLTALALAVFAAPVLLAANWEFAVPGLKAVRQDAGAALAPVEEYEYLDSSQRPVLRERREVRRSAPDADGQYEVSVRQQLTALRAVTLGAGGTNWTAGIKAGTLGGWRFLPGAAAAAGSLRVYDERRRPLAAVERLAAEFRAEASLVDPQTGAGLRVAPGAGMAEARLVAAESELVLLPWGAGRALAAGEEVEGAFTLAVLSPRQLGVLTPPLGAAPRINGAMVVGVRPGHELLQRLAVTGERPLTVSVESLPPGLEYVAASQVLRGRVAAAGTYPLRIVASNRCGRAERTLELVVGETIALTPPLGWNSWNCFAERVTAADIRAAAGCLIASGLADCGWQYVNVDDCWQRPSELGGPRQRGADGVFLTSTNFPSMRELAESVHALGLKIGLYSSPGERTCARCEGSLGFEALDADTFAAWGFDYLKYDACSYVFTWGGSGGHDQVAAENFWYHVYLPQQEANAFTAELREVYARPYRRMARELARQERDIVYSLCQYGLAEVWRWGAAAGGNCWRTTGDIVDDWESIVEILHRQVGLERYAAPGHWNDPDMLCLGQMGFGNLHPVALTPNELYTHVSLWAMLNAPLLIGCDLTQLDEFTLGLLANVEVLELNQDRLGVAASRIRSEAGKEVWAKPLAGGGVALALVNLTDHPAEIACPFAALALSGRWQVRDVWRQCDLGVSAREVRLKVPVHATVLLRLTPQPGAQAELSGGEWRDWAYRLATRTNAVPIIPKRPCTNCW